MWTSFAVFGFNSSMAALINFVYKYKMAIPILDDDVVYVKARKSFLGIVATAYLLFFHFQATEYTFIW